MRTVPNRAARAAAMIACLATAGCSTAGGADERAARVSPTPGATASANDIQHPVTYFNLTEEEALDLLASLEERELEALHDGDLGALRDVFTLEGTAGRAAARTIIGNYRRGVVERTTVEAVRTEVLSVTSQRVTFREVREVRPCRYTFYGHLDVTPDPRVRREVVVREMVERHLSWRIESDRVLRSTPTDERAECPPS